MPQFPLLHRGGRVARTPPPQKGRTNKHVSWPEHRWRIWWERGFGVCCGAWPGARGLAGPLRLAGHCPELRLLQCGEWTADRGQAGVAEGRGSTSVASESRACSGSRASAPRPCLCTGVRARDAALLGLVPGWRPGTQGRRCAGHIQALHQTLTRRAGCSIEGGPGCQQSQLPPSFLFLPITAFGKHIVRCQAAS